MVHMTVICSHISGKWHIRLQVTAVVCCKLSFKAVVIRHSIQGVMGQQPCMVHCKVTVWSFGFLVQEQGGKGKQRGRNERSREGDGKGNGREKIMN